MRLGMMLDLIMSWKSWSRNWDRHKVNWKLGHCHAGNISRCRQYLCYTIAVWRRLCHHDLVLLLHRLLLLRQLLLGFLFLGILFLWSLGPIFVVDSLYVLAKLVCLKINFHLNFCSNDIGYSQRRLGPNKPSFSNIQIPIYLSRVKFLSPIM